MSGLLVIWNAKAPKTCRRILFRYHEGRSWRHRENWKFNCASHKKLKYFRWNIITPFLRFQKCNGAINIGLGNHYIEAGW